MNTTHPIARASIHIDTTLDKVWDALTNPVTVKKYFFGTDMVTDWTVGNAIYFRGVWEGKEYEDKGIVQTYVPMESLSYSYKGSSDQSPDVPENYDLVTYIVEEKDGGVELTITSTATTEEKAKHSEENWDMLLKEIQKLLTPMV